MVAELKSWPPKLEEMAPAGAGSSAVKASGKQSVAAKVMTTK
jgi:hypothetical protein